MLVRLALVMAGLRVSCTLRFHWPTAAAPAMLETPPPLLWVPDANDTRLLAPELAAATPLWDTALVTLLLLVDTALLLEISRLSFPP